VSSAMGTQHSPLPLAWWRFFSMSNGQRQIGVWAYERAGSLVNPEVKGADATRKSCGKQTVGLLQRRHISIGSVTPIGKESNSLEDVQAGLVHDKANVYTTYPDPHRSVWATKILPTMKQVPLAALEAACQGRLSRRALIDIRAGRSTPHRKNQEFLASVVRS
jgi:hypothetical protein